MQSRHIVLAALLHVVLFAFLFAGVQCSQPIPPTPVIQGVLINPSQLQQFKPPVPNPAQTKPDEADQGPQQIVKSDVVADEAKQQQEKAAAAQQLDQQKAQQEAAAKAAEEQRQKDEAAKAEELRQVEAAQKQAAEQAATQKKQQEEDAKRKAEADAAAAEAQHKKEMEEQIRKEAQQQQEAQEAALAQKKKAEEAQQAALLRKRQQELQAALGAESSKLTADIQNQWGSQLTAALAAVWARPPGTDQSLKAYIIITLSENGEVQNASVETSSGMSGFDDSVVSAAYKASPMPTPADPAAFRHKVEVCFSPNPRNCQQ